MGAFVSDLYMFGWRNSYEVDNMDGRDLSVTKCSSSRKMRFGSCYLVTSPRVTATTGAGLNKSAQEKLSLPKGQPTGP